MTDGEASQSPEQLLETPHLADALESDRFKKFLDHIPFAVAVAELKPSEHIAYANIEFERLIGQAAATIEGQPWTAVTAHVAALDDGRPLVEAVTAGEDYIGAFGIEQGEMALAVD